MFHPAPSSRATGFTLIELMLYVGILAAAGGALISILLLVTRAQSREVAGLEVMRQSQFVLQRVQSIVREASVIDAAFEGTNTAAPCAEFCTLKVRTSLTATDPTFITSTASGVYLVEGLGETLASIPFSSWVPITNSSVTVSRLTFAPRASSGGGVTVSVDGTFANDTTNPVLQFSHTLSVVVAHASAATFDSNLLPDSSNTRSIGQSSLTWRDLALSGNATVGGTVQVGAATLTGYGSPKRLSIDGGLTLSADESKPSCAESLRGLIWMTRSGSGSADTIEACIKGSGSSYAWKTFSLQ